MRDTSFAFKVAVVMPAYNVGRYISQALDSIIGQSLNFANNIQIIIVNDNSRDDTLKIAEKYSDSGVPGSLITK